MKVINGFITNLILIGIAIILLACSMTKIDVDSVILDNYQYQLNKVELKKEKLNEINSYGDIVLNVDDLDINDLKSSILSTVSNLDDLRKEYNGYHLISMYTYTINNKYNTLAVSNKFNYLLSSKLNNLKINENAIRDLYKNDIESFKKVYVKLNTLFSFEESEFIDNLDYTKYINEVIAKNEFDIDKYIKETKEKFNNKLFEMFYFYYGDI